MDDSIPALDEAKQFASSCFRSLSSADGLIRFRLCELVERSVVATADDEDIEVLCSAAYLQEVGVVHSSKEKAIYSLQMCQRFFEDSIGDLHPILEDCILNHVRSGIAISPEARLMQICHKYATTHYLDYMLLKQQISEAGFERLQMERIEAYSAYLNEHPRGRAIGEILYAIFHEIRAER
jgi:hypothetical protein